LENGTLAIMILKKAGYKALATRTAKEADIGVNTNLKMPF
jgi:hypothetical protein